MCREHSSFCLKTLSGCAESLLLHLGFLCVWQAGLLFPAGHIFLTLGSALPCGARLSVGAALPCWAWPSHCAGCSSLRIMTFSLWGLPFPVGHDLLCEGCSSLRVMTFSLWGLPFPVGHDLLCWGCSSLWGMAFSLWGLLFPVGHGLLTVGAALVAEPCAWLHALQELFCSLACGIFPDQGLYLCSLHWQADSQPLYHQRGPVLFHCALIHRAQSSLFQSPS